MKLENVQRRKKADSDAKRLVESTRDENQKNSGKEELGNTH